MRCKGKLTLDREPLGGSENFKTGPTFPREESEALACTAIFCGFVHFFEFNALASKS